MSDLFSPFDYESDAATTEPSTDDVFAELAAQMRDLEPSYADVFAQLDAEANAAVGWGITDIFGDLA